MPFCSFPSSNMHALPFSFLSRILSFPNLNFHFPRFRLHLCIYFIYLFYLVIIVFRWKVTWTQSLKETETSFINCFRKGFVLSVWIVLTGRHPQGYPSQYYCNQSHQWYRYSCVWKHSLFLFCLFIYLLEWRKVTSSEALGEMYPAPITILSYFFHFYPDWFCIVICVNGLFDSWKALLFSKL